MVSLYIASTNPYAGKSLITMGLGLRMKSDGFKIGYFKPFGKIPSTIGEMVVDKDAEFMRNTLGLDDPLDLVSPVVLTHDLLRSCLKGKSEDQMKKIKSAYNKISEGKDILLIGGAGDLYDGTFLGIPPLKIIKSLNLNVILIDPYLDETCIDCILAAKENLKERFLGVVLNRVLPKSIEYISDFIVPFLNTKGVEVLGLLPQDLILNSITVSQINDALSGRVLCCEDSLSEMVENISIGAMNVDDALKYFSRKQNKVVITGGDRADIQLAALETSTKCIVLTGELFPNDLIINKAKEARVPIILVKDDTLTTVEKLESILGKIRIRESEKVKRAEEIINQRIDFKKIYEKIGHPPISTLNK